MALMVAASCCKMMMMVLMVAASCCRMTMMALMVAVSCSGPKLQGKDLTKVAVHSSNVADHCIAPLLACLVAEDQVSNIFSVMAMNEL